MSLTFLIAYSRFTATRNLRSSIWCTWHICHVTHTLTDSTHCGAHLCVRDLVYTPGTAYNFIEVHASKNVWFRQIYLFSFFFMCERPDIYIYICRLQHIIFIKVHASRNVWFRHICLFFLFPFLKYIMELFADSFMVPAPVFVDRSYLEISTFTIFFLTDYYNK